MQSQFSARSQGVPSSTGLRCFPEKVVLKNPNDQQAKKKNYPLTIPTEQKQNSIGTLERK